jgi:hypothetical protein
MMDLALEDLRAAAAGGTVRRKLSGKRSVAFASACRKSEFDRRQRNDANRRPLQLPNRTSVLFLRRPLTRI